MELRVLGPTEVRHDGSPVRLRGAKSRELLALLSIRANRPVPSDELIEQLWEGDPPPSAATALRVHIGHLRQILELDRSSNSPSSRLPTGPHGYRLRVEPDELDAQRFERLIVLAREAAANGDPACAVPQLTDALDLWRGPALFDVRHLSATRSEITRLDELRALAIEELADARLALGEHTLAVDLLTAALEQYPLRERLTASLMLALYRSARQADALRVYASLARRLDEQLGVPPSEDLRRLEEDILVQRRNLEFMPSHSARHSTSVGRLPGVRFIGRRNELFRLLQLHAEGGPESRFILISGSAGIGKTTLVQEYSTRLQRLGVAAPLTGVCTPEQPAGYEPIAQILQQVDETRWRSGLRDVLGAKGADAEAARFRFFEAIVRELVPLADQRRAIVLEDVHWADRPTLLLIRHVARHPALQDLTVVATFRDDELGDARAELIEGLAPPARVERLHLEAFTDNEVRALVRATAPPETMHSLVDRSTMLYEVTGGNPFFLRELLRELDEESIKIDEGSDFARTLAEIAPAGVRTLVDRRMARLTRRGRQVIWAAAVIGRDISVDILAAVCGLSDHATLDAIEESLAARLLVEDLQRVDRYLFPHALVPNAIYKAIPTRQRRRLHARTAHALEATGDDAVHRNAELARHFYEAAEPELGLEAARYAKQAADDAATQFAFSEAARWYERAVRLGHDLGASPAELGHLQLALGQAFANDKQAEPARDAFLLAAECARDAHDAALLADVALAADGPWSTGSEFQRVALALLEEALVGVGERDARRRVAILNGIASDLYYVDPDREGQVAREAMQLARSLNDPAALATAQLAVHRWHTHQPEARCERLALATTALDLTARPGCPPELRLLIRRSMLADLLENGEIEAFDAGLDDYAAMATSVGSPRDIYWSIALRATQAILRGDLTEGEQLARGAALRGHELAQLSDGAYLLQRFVVRFQQARLAEEVPALRAAGRAGSVFRAGAALAAVAYGEVGHIERALDIVRATLGPDGSDLPRDVFWLAANALFASVVASSDDRELVRLLSHSLLPYGEHVVVFGTGAAVLGTGHHWLGLLASARGEHGAALEHLSEAKAAAERINAPYWVAQALIEAANVLAARDGPGDAGNLHRLVGQARVLAEPGGYLRVLVQAEALA